jgi:hypothetical protein
MTKYPHCGKYYDRRMKANQVIIHDQAKDVQGKPKVGYVLKSLMNAIAKVREYGNSKYPDGGVDNWRLVNIDEYYHALRRHVDSMCDAHFNTKSRESTIDAESKMPHAWHAATNVMFIIELLEELEATNSLPKKEL